MAGQTVGERSRVVPPRPYEPRRQGTLIPFKQGGMFFSTNSSWQQRALYSIVFVTFLVYSLIVVFSVFFEPVCKRKDQIRADINIDMPFVNPHYHVGCKDVRYAILMGLTPRECDLGRRMFAAVMCGGTVGFERRRLDRPAGIRTMALVALGSCIFTITSMFAFSDGPMTWDSSRVTAAIPSGVGFLGAGLIWRSRKTRATNGPGDDEEKEQVHGLTTAASTWVAASVGIASGGALYFVSGFGVMTLLLVLRFGPRTPPNERLVSAAAASRSHQADATIIYSPTHPGSDDEVDDEDTEMSYYP